MDFFALGGIQAQSVQWEAPQASVPNTYSNHIEIH